MRARQPSSHPFRLQHEGGRAAADGCEAERRDPAAEEGPFQSALSLATIGKPRSKAAGCACATAGWQRPGDERKVDETSQQGRKVPFVPRR